MTAPENPSEKPEFGSSPFVKKLHELAVADQEKEDPRYIFQPTPDTAKRSSIPWESQQCIAEIVETPRLHLDKTKEIFAAIWQLTRESRQNVNFMPTITVTFLERIITALVNATVKR